VGEPYRRTAQFTLGESAAYTFNLWHETVALSPLDAQVMPLLDGTRDRAALVEEMLAIARSGLIRIELDGTLVTDESDLREVLGQFVDAMPERLEEMKLLRVSDPE
jgi:methyltransferase-like protein